MKKIFACFVVLFLTGTLVNAQTQSKQAKVKTVKVSTKNRILVAVQSQRTKAAINRAKAEAKKEGE